MKLHHLVLKTALPASLALTFLAPGSHAANQSFPANPTAWPEMTRESRPWAFNWWLGSAVDTNSISTEFRRYRDAGLGGIHIIPIYRAKGAKERSIDYLTPRWMDMMRYSIEEGGRLDLGVDMTTGSGWCFGGPNISDRQGGWKLTTRELDLAPAQEFSEKLDLASVLALLAETNGSPAIDLRSQLAADGTLKWSSGTAAKLYIVTAAPGGNEVKRSAPGGSGLMINPFDPEVMTNYLKRFTTAFDAYHGPTPRAMYHDSFEYNSTWSPNLLRDFAQARHYRLEDNWPAFCSDPRTNDTAARVRADFKETLSDLMVERVFPEWIRWSRSRGMITRFQAHGSPGNLLDLYALADVPETEMFGRGTRDPMASGFDSRFSEGDRDPLVSKFASSAAHLTGRPRVSSETGTWMAEHFCETLEEMKCLVDLLFVSGINHVFYHGTCFSPDDLPWPGWLFYASTEMNPRNSIWHDALALNTYIARCQSVLQSGRPDNDVLLYWPLHDFWHSGSQLVFGLSVHNRGWIEGQPIGDSAKWLWDHGYGFDYVSDRLLKGVDVSANGAVSISSNAYRVIVIPTTTHLPLETLEKLLNLARAGASVVFEKQLPQDVPGQNDLAARRTAFHNLLQPLTSASSQSAIKLGKGQVLVGELEEILKRLHVPRESIADHPGALVIRRSHDDGRHYFIANQSATTMSGWFSLGTPAKSVVALDPMSGRSGLLASHTGANGLVEIPLRLDPGESILLRTFEHRKVNGHEWQWFTPAATALELPGSWNVDFLNGGPKLPASFEATALKSWTLNGDPEAERFAGTAVYRTTFDAPSGKGPWLLDLGKVCHSARVKLNGKDRGVSFMNPHRIQIDGLKSRRNQLEIEVTNLSANRIRDLDRSKVPYQNFYYANIRYKPFDASDWPILDSGLLGPVRLLSTAPRAK